MIEKEAITALQEGSSICHAHAAVAYALSADHPTGVAALPAHFQLNDLESYLPQRRRLRGKMITQSLPAFAAYAQKHAEQGATVFVDASAMRATAVLNLGTPEQPGHADNRATLQAERTAPYSGLHAATLKRLSQKEAAEFVEDHMAHIQCVGEAGPISPASAVSALRRVTIEGLRRVENEEKSLSANRSTFESVSATSKEPFPAFIHFTCVPYAGLTERTFVLRVGVLTTDDKPSITLRPINMELHQEEMAQELATLVNAAFDASAGIDVLLGSYEAAR